MTAGTETIDRDEALDRAVRATDLDTLWEALSPLRGRLTDDPAVARAWAEALGATPRRPTLREEAETLLDAWPSDPGIVGACCDALIRVEGRRPVDEPPLEEGPASVAATAAGRCLGKLPGELAQDPDIGGMLHALRGNALALLGPKRTDDAVAALAKALGMEERASWRFDLGLLYKRAGRFPDALEAFRAARAGEPEPRKGTLWNVAICATACGEAETAADAWTALGLEVRTESGLPFVEGLDPVQVRLPTLGSGTDPTRVVPDEAAGFEIVWAQPLSPCHGVVRSPTHREAAADFGDVILWDGAPVAVREIEGRPVPRFPFLGRLKAGDERRFRFLALQQEEGQVAAIGEGLPEGVVLYPHGERVEMVCPRCAAGDTLVKHEHLPKEQHRVVFGKLVVPAQVPLPHFAHVLDEARAAQPGVLLAIPDLYEALGDTAQAGKHHKRWGTIERTASSSGLAG
ncbi:MAG: hypothetical protein RID81_20100 [Sandaracinaceae bacterium]